MRSRGQRRAGTQSCREQAVTSEHYIWREVHDPAVVVVDLHTQRL